MFQRRKEYREHVEDASRYCCDVDLYLVTTYRSRREDGGGGVILAAILMGEAFLVKKIVKIRQEAGSLISDEGSRSWDLKKRVC